MATADEILATMSAEEEKAYLVIESDLRTITIPDEIKILGVESDDDVLRLHFKMPKMYGEFDLSEFELRVNYMNAGNEPDLYEVKDAAVSGDVIEFSWLVGRTAAKVKGDVKFIVCAKLVKADGVVEKEFNTTVAKLPVLEGLETSKAVVQLHPDVIEAILLRLSKLETSGGVTDEQIANAVNAYLTENPVTPGATQEQAEQIAANKEAIEELQKNGAGGGDPAGTASAAVNEHNTDDGSHEDIRQLIVGLSNRLNTLADSDDTTLDQLSEIVAYIKSNKSLIDSITTGKVSVSDIVDNLTTNVNSKPLSAAQGVKLKQLIDAIVIPASLPNPQPIVINGVSYDGSVKKEVTIQPGSSTGGAAIDDTTPSATTTYSSEKIEAELSAQKEANDAQDERMAAIEKTVAGIPGSETSLQAFIDNTDIDYAYDSETGANYTVIRVYKNKLDGSKQFPFVYAPNGAGAGTKSTYDMTVEDGWLLAINAGVFDTSTKKPDGIVIQNGVVIQNGQTVTHSQNKPLTIDANGNLGSAAYNADANALVSTGVVSAVVGFIPIIVDYVPVSQSEWNSISNYTQNAQRQIIGQFGNGDYAIVTCEGRNYDNSDGWTLAEAQTVCAKLGLKFAYNLDGGGSTETMLGYKHINTIYENTTGRIVPTFIVFNGGTNAPEYDGDIEPDEPTVTLTSISATYNGGDVEVGTALTALTGITVTANYSDGSTATVTDYTLSGTIAEGSNTITVSYGGKTTDFTVVGVVSDSGDGDMDLPTGYTAAAYIASDGNAYTDNLYTPTATTGFEYAYMVDTYSTATNGPHVFAGQTYHAPMIQNGTGNFHASRLGGALDVSCTLTLGVKYTVRAFVDDDMAIISKDGTVMTSGSVAAGTEQSSDMRLFGYQANTNYNLKGKIYYFRIFESGELVRNYIPCINSDGVAGLYETLNGTFHSSTSGTEYTAIRKVPCTGITLDQTTLTFTATGTQTLTATVTPSDTTDAVIWSSNDDSIATVVGGVVTVKANGSATITATCGEYSATCEISVSGIGEGSGGTGEIKAEIVKNIQRGSPAYTANTDLKINMATATRATANPNFFYAEVGKTYKFTVSATYKKGVQAYIFGDKNVDFSSDDGEYNTYPDSTGTANRVKDSGWLSNGTPYELVADGTWDVFSLHFARADNAAMNADDYAAIYESLSIIVS